MVLDDRFASLNNFILTKKEKEKERDKIFLDRGFANT